MGIDEQVRSENPLPPTTMSAGQPLVYLPTAAVICKVHLMDGDPTLPCYLLLCMKAAASASRQYQDSTITIITRDTSYLMLTDIMHFSRCKESGSSNAMGARRSMYEPRARTMGGGGFACDEVRKNVLSTSNW